MAAIGYARVFPGQWLRTPLATARAGLEPADEPRSRSRVSLAPTPPRNRVSRDISTSSAKRSKFIQRAPRTRAKSTYPSSGRGGSRTRVSLSRTNPPRVRKVERLALSRPTHHTMGLDARQPPAFAHSLHSWRDFNTSTSVRSNVRPQSLHSQRRIQRFGPEGTCLSKPLIERAWRVPRTPRKTRTASRRRDARRESKDLRPYGESNRTRDCSVRTSSKHLSSGEESS